MLALPPPRMHRVFRGAPCVQDMPDDAAHTSRLWIVPRKPFSSASYGDLTQVRAAGKRVESQSFVETLRSVALPDLSGANIERHVDAVYVCALHPAPHTEVITNR